MFKHVAACLLALGFVLAPVAEAAAQQTGSIGITATDRQSGQPLSGIQVRVVDTQLGGITDANGRVVITQVPVGTRSIVATSIGYNEVRRTDITVTANQLATVTVELEQAVLSLQEIIATGVTDPTEGVKLPMTVSRIGADQLSVPTTGSALNAMAGKIAGVSVIRTSGQPGSGVNIQLRSLTGIQTDSSPMIVVDGVILSTTLGNTSASDIESLDIESIEVIKGAAAAALYGSRAAAGVVTITTNRGRNLPQDVTRFNFRTEYGRDVLASTVPIGQSHPYLMNEERTAFVNPDGEEVTWNGRFYKSDWMADNPYPGPVFDNLRALYRPGQYLQNSFNMSQNTQSTAFTTSLVHLNNAGALENNKGYDRVTGRVTLDHRVGERVNLSVVGNHSRTSRDDISGNPYQAILSYPAFVDLTKRDANGLFVQQPDLNVELENPLWRQASRDNMSWSARTLGSLNLRFVPTSWISTDAQISYDRSDNHGQVYVPKGTPTSLTSDAVSNGQLSYSNARTTTYNGYAGATARQRFADLNLRLTTRALFEREERRFFNAEGRDLIVPGVQDLNMAESLHAMNSSWSEIRSLGYLADLAVDYQDRYIASILVRRDGSSLFGPNNRWRTFRRAAVAYRMSQEDWFDIPAINELKFRYAMGEAGGRPNFDDQFELWNVMSDCPGNAPVCRYTQGNPNLRPQFTREQDIGIDIIAFNNRVSLELVYAFQTSRDQVITLPAINISGFSNVRGNGATIAGNTYEATIQAFPIRTRDLTWSVSAVMDRSRNEITYWDRSCYVGTQSGFTGGNQYVCEGSQLGDFYMTSLTKSLDDLPSWLDPIRDQFQLNDEGYVVWVGSHEGASWRDGLTEKCRAEGTCWGTTTNAGGFLYRWGEPFAIRDETGSFDRPYVGTGISDLNFGFTNNLTYRGLTFYTAFRGQIGGQIYNDTRQWMYGQRRHGDVDQTGRPDELKKTSFYYTRGLYNGNNWTADYLEDGSYLRLGEASLRYRFNRDQLSRVFGGAAPENLQVGINGRNLWTLTNYSGFNPEAGSQTQRVDSINYPNTRTFTATFDITF